MKYVSYFDVIAVFLISSIITLVYTMAWARIFTGDFLDINPFVEIIRVFTVAIAMTLFFVAYTSFPRGNGRNLVLFGMTVEFFFLYAVILTLKYSLVFPQFTPTYIFFIFDFLAFASFFPALVGLSKIMK